MTATAKVGYQFDNDKAELERLSLQGRVLGPATRTILEMAGIEPGMAVLDLGSGAGDVSFLAAEMVGPKGQVIGIDASVGAVARATRRARERNITNVRFSVGDIHDAVSGGPFDVVTGRLVLMHVSEPCAVLQTQARVLRPGGLVVVMELDASLGRSVPPTPLVERLGAWIVEVFNRGGIHASLGPKLWSVLEDVGLHPGGMIGIKPCFGPDDRDGSTLLAAVVRTLTPLMERTTVATIDEIEPATLQDRLMTELSTARAVFEYPALYGAWATINP
jgi:2-polyprenyl-3-methyl-5-hydroxy-6-metoxy-1,4-benzoquinol methylase